ncbi:signal transduction histidine kinase [Azospirillum agricola]|uniref:ATP-binding protein n=1 Tax=Azospirillum agricola TaxID=1720247 RepID=UPI001AE2BFE5|nr:HAMP domain-containing sensor histidine kinase [Azospirillum agricola]MBP2228732.1 signal transduction histidine kinase [Azospirillum agricola]
MRWDSGPGGSRLAGGGLAGNRPGRRRRWRTRVRTLLDTRSFRQTMTVGAVFVVVTAGAVLWSRTLLVDLVKDHVTELLQRDVETQRQFGGLAAAPALADQVRYRERLEPETPRKRLVLDGQGRLLHGEAGEAGRLLAALSCDPARLTACATGRIDRRGDGGTLQALVVPLGDGGRFVSAYDIQPMLEQVKAVPLVAGVGVLVFLLTSVSFGVHFSSGTLRRVDAIAEALASYAGGDRNRRIAIGPADDEFASLGREINRTLDRVNRLVEEVSSVSSSIAHELRTPLTHLHNRLATIAEGCADEPLRRELEEGIEETRRIQRLFRAIMRLGEIETARCSMSMEPLDAAALLEEIRESYLPLAEEGGIALTVAAHPAPRLRGDRTLLFQAVANLVDNALKYAADGGAVTLSARIRDGWEELCVADRGRGLSPGQRALAVQRFFRFDPSGTVPGHGLGLAIVRAIATLHGGGLLLEDNGPGLLAVIRLGRHADRPPPLHDAK